jgi:predicted nucleic acid-binding protein
MVNALRSFSKMLDTLPSVTRSSDPTDNLFLAMSEAGRADFLVTGDKSGLLSLKKHRKTRIVTARTFADSLR